MPAQTITGLVTKAGVMAKTVTMTVEKRLTHPKLLKTYTRHQKYLVHDESQVLSVGDRIIAQACRPLSARKRFTLSSLVGGANAGEERRAAAEKMISAEEREKMRIERVVKEEVGRRNSGTGAVGKEASRR